MVSRFRQLVVMLLLTCLCCSSAIRTTASESQGLVTPKSCRCSSPSETYPFSIIDLQESTSPSGSCKQTCGDNSCGSGGCSCSAKPINGEEQDPAVLPQPSSEKHPSGTLSDTFLLILPTLIKPAEKELVYLGRIHSQSVFYDFFSPPSCGGRSPPA